MVKTCLIWFGNFFKIGNNAEHDWSSVGKFLANPNKLLQLLSDFDFDSVSGPTVKRIKNMELY